MNHHNKTAYIPISTGCNQFCSYCIVPYARGLEKHYSKDKVALIDKATKEKMEYGTKVHAILEELNLNNPDLNQGEKYNVC